ncbi:Mbeg1-like protein [Dyella sp.]|uniref:Mbeg1-like protein n=1 Tax=Dyella sp. TaxID=1869338 RepID=UPI002ED34015
MPLDAAGGARPITDNLPIQPTNPHESAIATAIPAHTASPQLPYNIQGQQLAAQARLPVPQGGFSAQVEGKDAEPIDMDMAKLAQDCYNLDSKNIDGWTRLSDDQLKAAGIDPKELDDPSTGFRAAVYQDGKGDKVLAFAGTDPKSLKDWKADATQALGIDTAQYNQAIKLATQAKAAFGNNLAITGHSLGGGLASAASVVTDTPAVTFNAAGVNNATLKRFVPDGNLDAMKSQANDGLVRRYAVKGEVLTGEQETGVASGLIPDAIGHKIELRNPNRPNWTLEFPGINLITDTVTGGMDHTMGAVLTALQRDQPWDHNGNYLRDDSVVDRIADKTGQGGSAVAKAVDTATDKTGDALKTGADKAANQLDKLGTPGHLAGNVLRFGGTAAKDTVKIFGDLTEGGIGLGTHLLQGAEQFTGGAIKTGVNLCKSAGHAINKAMPWNW